MRNEGRNQDQQKAQGRAAWCRINIYILGLCPKNVPSLSNWAIPFGLRMAKFAFWRLLPWRPRRMGRRSASCYLLHLAAGPGVMKLEVEQGTPQGIPPQASLLTYWGLVCFAWMLSFILYSLSEVFPRIFVNISLCNTKKHSLPP